MIEPLTSPALKPALMCWTMSSGIGKPAGSADRTVARTFGPPVDAQNPIAEARLQASGGYARRLSLAADA